MVKRAKSHPPKKSSRKSANKAADPPSRRSYSTWIAAAVLAATIAVLYGRAIHAPFIFDDDISIIKNTSIHSLWPPLGTTEQPGPLRPGPDQPTSARPLVNLSFALNYRIGEFNPAGYRVVNVIIHFGCAMLMWAIVWRTLRLPYFENRLSSSADWLALGVALLWAVHPLQTEAVVYVSQRTELMMAFFYLATMYCSLRYWKAGALEESVFGSRIGNPAATRGAHRGLWLTLAATACLAGMASKEVMVSAPLIVLLFERAFVSGSIAKSLRRSWPLYVALASTWILLFALTVNNQRSNSAGFNLGVPALTWWMTQSKVLLMYLKLAVWPWPLLIHYELPYIDSFADAWMYVVPVVVIGIVTLVLLWRNSPIGFLLTFLFAILSPTLVVPILTEMAAERRMYLPLGALILLAAVGVYGIARWFANRRAGAVETRSRFAIVTFAVVSGLIAIVWCLISANRLQAYQSELELWQDVLRRQPQNAIAHLNAGLHLDQAGDLAAATEHYREAVRIDPQSAQAQYGLGVLLSKSGAHGEAADHFAAASRFRPDDIRTKLNLSGALFLVGRFQESAEASRAAVEADPNDWTAYNNLGMALQKLGKYDEAIETFNQALRLNSKAFDLYNDIADTYVLANRPNDAIASLESGLAAARSAGDTQSVEKFNTRLHAMRGQ